MFDILIVGLIRNQQNLLRINLEQLARGRARCFYGIYSDETLLPETKSLFKRFDVTVLDLGPSPTYSIPIALKILEPKNSRNSYILFDRMNKMWDEYLGKCHDPASTIIRLRPDMLVTKVGQLPSSNTILYVGHDYGIASDNFAFGSKNTMSIYMNAIETLRKEWSKPLNISNYHNIPVGERLMRTHLIKNDVIFKRPMNITIRIVRKYRAIYKLTGYWKLFVYLMKDATSVLSDLCSMNNE